MPSYLALEQISDLVLDTLGFTKQAFVNGQPLETALSTPHIVDAGCAILDCASQEVFRVGPYVVTLGLHCQTTSQ